MDTIVKALIKFYQKLGGTPSDLRLNATAADVIDAISDTYTDKEGTHVEVTTELSEGTKVATVTTNNTEHDIYAPTPDSVSITAELSEGTKVATVTINDVDTDIYAPAGGGGVSPIIIDLGTNMHSTGMDISSLLPTGITISGFITAVHNCTPVIIKGSNPGSMNQNFESIYLYDVREDLDYSERNLHLRALVTPAGTQTLSYYDITVYQEFSGGDPSQVTSEEILFEYHEDNLS